MAIRTSNQITFTEQKKIVEIREWYLATPKSTGVTRDDERWTLEVQTIDETKKYLWNYEEVIYSIGSSEVSDPIIIGFYGKGTDGKGISDIKNYYYITQIPELPESPEWSPTVLLLTPTNKYLWNYEEFIYTDGSSKPTDPAIIGVYGDGGTETVDFQIYSVDGFEFSDSLTSITLKTAAIQGGQVIESGASYKWLWWNRGSTLDDKYEIIPGETSSTLTIDDTDAYALTSLKCEMTYKEIVYEDYVSLEKKTDVYTATIKFWNGNNIITSDKDYIIAYVELYQNNTIKEGLRTDNIYISDVNIVQNDIIITDINGTFSNGDRMYFVCKKMDNDVVEYGVVLGEYASGEWKLITSNYIYYNDLFLNSTSNVIFIPKEKIPRSLNINFEIYDDKTVVARTNTIVLDLNDPMVSDTEPTDPKEGQLWLDKSVSPSILKMWDGTQWVNSGYQNGNVVYTSQPIDGYSKGDLWILEEDYGKFSQGSMLKAIRNYSSAFNMLDWEDANDVITNVKESFTWDDGGIQIAQKVVDSNGKSTNPFYVHIDSKRMGFHSVTYNSDGTTDDVEVVHIGNNSAVIQNATFEGVNGTTFNNNTKFKQQVQFWNFVFTKESDGSLSLSVQQIQEGE